MIVVIAGKDWVVSETMPGVILLTSTGHFGDDHWTDPIEIPLAELDERVGTLTARKIKEEYLECPEHFLQLLTDYGWTIVARKQSGNGTYDAKFTRKLLGKPREYVRVDSAGMNHTARWYHWWENGDEEKYDKTGFSSASLWAFLNLPPVRMATPTQVLPPSQEAKID